LEREDEIEIKKNDNRAPIPDPSPSLTVSQVHKIRNNCVRPLTLCGC